MYRSKFEIERKLKQIKYNFKDLMKFRNRVFVNNGIDQETGCYPLEIKLGTFLIYCRSIFQYDLKEVRIDPEKKRKYDEFIGAKRIINHFKDLRDSEIHSFSISTHQNISFNTPIINFDKDAGIAEGEKVSLLVEDLEDLDLKSENEPEAKIRYTITKRLELTTDLIEQFNNESRIDLLKAIDEGRPLFESQEFDGITDLFVLCEKYLDSIERFIEFAENENLIT